MSRCAITPSDSGAPPAGVAIGPTVADCVERFPAPAQHPVNVANRERSMRVVNFAISIADDVVPSVIAENAVSLDYDGDYWFDINRPNLAEPDQGTFWTSEEIAECEKRIARALKYIELRDPDAVPWRFIRHPEQPHLVRFEDKP